MSLKNAQIYQFILVLCSIQAILGRTVENKTRTNSNLLSSNNVAPAADNNDYYYDYELTNDNTSSQDTEAELLPAPESLLEVNAVIGHTPELGAQNAEIPQIPDNSLADTDLHDHDVIDNIMYIYYGRASNGYSYTFGAEIILIGAILSCAALILTIVCTLLRKVQNVKNDIFKISINTIVILCATHLLFMFGVYATKYRERCKLIAVSVHYLNLVVSMWIFAQVYIVYKKFMNEYVPKLRFVMLLAYGVPAFIVLLCYGIDPNSYESKKFCSMSVEKGMFINFVLPVMSLIVATTSMALNGIRKINMELSKYELSSTDSIMDLETSKSKIIIDNRSSFLDFRLNGSDDVSASGSGSLVAEDSYLNSLHLSKKCLKLLAIWQTSHAVVWFIAVLALQYSESSAIMPFIYAISTSVLNWYIFAKSKYLTANTKNLLSMNRISCSPTDLSLTDMNKGNLMDDVTLTSSGVNSQHCEVVPLLDAAAASDHYTTTEFIQLRNEVISTISN